MFTQKLLVKHIHRNERNSHLYFFFILDQTLSLEKFTRKLAFRRAFWVSTTLSLNHITIWLGLWTRYFTNHKDIEFLSFALFLAFCVSLFMSVNHKKWWPFKKCFRVDKGCAAKAKKFTRFYLCKATLFPFFSSVI